MEKYFCALEPYCNLTPAKLICHLLSMPGLTWEKITPARTDQKELFYSFQKNTNSLLW